MYNTILIPVSFDESRDLAGAIDVARALGTDGARITFLHVNEVMQSYLVDVIPPETIQSRKDAVEAEMTALTAGLKDAHGVVVEGSAGREITKWARENKADCIVVASHSPRFSDMFLGSTAAWVVRHAHCAVHVLR